jgi:uncharacterized LabA/DUF88 family protein
MRAFYYTSTYGDADRIAGIEELLRAIDFEPHVYHRLKNGRSKSVDIALTTDMLCNAFRDNFDVAFLVAGDADYLPLVKEVQRLGKFVTLCFLERPAGGLSKQLRLAADRFMALDSMLLTSWRQAAAMQFR